MMSKSERIFIRWLTAFLYGCALFTIVGVAIWYLPRQVVKSASLMQTDKIEYSVGDKIVVTGETWTNVDASADFDVRLICNGVKYQYTKIAGLQVSKQAAPVKYSFPYPEIPLYIPKGSTCRIETTSSYIIQVLPMMNKTYQYRFTSNVFQVKE